MFQINIETHLKLYFSNIFLVIITTSISLSNNTGNLPLKRVSKILTLPFILNKWTSLIGNPKLNRELFGFFFSRAGARAFQLYLFYRAGAGAFRLHFSAQSWSWSLKALGIKLEQIVHLCPTLVKSHDHDHVFLFGQSRII